MKLSEMTLASSDSGPTAKLLGLDVGDRRVGVAASDELGRMAFSRGVFKRRGREADLAQVRGLVDSERAGLVVVGLPLHLDGGVSEQARKTERFAAWLRAGLDCPVVLWDERLSTSEARALLAEAGHRRSRRRERLDAEAARILLQDYIDAERAR